MTGEKLPMVSVLIHNRTFLYLWLSQILSQFAANITLFLLGILVYQKTGSNALVSGLFLSFGIPSVFFGLIAGTAVDYIDKRSIILYSCVIRAALVIGLLAASDSIALVYILLFFNAIVSQFFVPAEATLIPKLVSADHLISANSLFSFAYYGSVAGGFILAGPLLRIFGPYWSLSILALLYGISWWISLRLPSSGKDTDILRKLKRLRLSIVIQRFLISLSDGFQYVRHSRVLFESVLLLTGTQIIIAILSVLGPGFADRVLGVDVTDASLFVVGPVIAGILLGGIWVGNQGYRYRTSILMNTGILGAGCTLSVISLSVYLNRIAGGTGGVLPNWFMTPLVIVFFFLLGVFNSFLDVPANSVLQKEATGMMRGRVYGILGAFVGGVGIVPVIAGGVLADVIGVGKVIFAVGLCVSVYGLYRIRFVRMNQ